MPSIAKTQSSQRLEGASVGAAKANRPRSSGQSPEAGSGRFPDSPGPRVLLVDDNAFSRRVTQTQLGRLGCSVDAAASGQEALAAIDRRAYDLVLMDCEMPNLDGRQTTAVIRERESGRRHLPIVAMTAHEAASERQRCLSAGMDGFLAKPARDEDLRAALARHTGLPPATPSQPGQSEPRLDQEALSTLRSLDASSPGFLGQIVADFTHTAEDRLNAAVRAARAGDAAGLAAAAHSLRGSSALLGALGMAESCRCVEEDARRGDLAGAGDILARVKSEYEVVARALRAEAATSGAAPRPAA